MRLLLTRRKRPNNYIAIPLNKKYHCATILFWWCQRNSGLERLYCWRECRDIPRIPHVRLNTSSISISVLLVRADVNKENTKKNKVLSIYRNNSVIYIINKSFIASIIYKYVSSVIDENEYCSSFDTNKHKLLFSLCINKST